MILHGVVQNGHGGHFYNSVDERPDPAVCSVGDGAQAVSDLRLQSTGRPVSTLLFRLQSTDRCAQRGGTTEAVRINAERPNDASMYVGVPTLLNVGMGFAPDSRPPPLPTLAALMRHDSSFTTACRSTTKVMRVTS